MATPASLTLEKGLVLLGLVISDGGRNPLSTLAEAAGLPESTTHRILGSLQRQGFVARAGRGAYLPGPALMRLGQVRSLSEVLRDISRPVLKGIAKRTGLTAHLGVFEGDMVTYLVKVEGETTVLTREDMQLEAYCSGIGKVLLASLPQSSLAHYLSGGPFVRLTPNTLIDPIDLAHALDNVRAQGFAMDNSEIVIGLQCVAAPVRADNGEVCCAISLSGPSDRTTRAILRDDLPVLLEAAEQIQGRLTPR